MERRQAHSSSIVALARRDARAARRGPPRDDRGPLSALHRGDFRPGPTLPAPAVDTGAAQRLPASGLAGLTVGVSASRGCGSPAVRETPLLTPSWEPSPETPLLSEDANRYSINSLRSQVKIHAVASECPKERAARFDRMRIRSWGCLSRPRISQHYPRPIIVPGDQRS